MELQTQMRHRHELDAETGCFLTGGKALVVDPRPVQFLMSPEEPADRPEPSPPRPKPERVEGRTPLDYAKDEAERITAECLKKIRDAEELAAKRDREHKRLRALVRAGLESFEGTNGLTVRDLSLGRIKGKRFHLVASIVITSPKPDAAPSVLPAAYFRIARGDDYYAEPVPYTDEDFGRAMAAAATVPQPRPKRP